MRPGFIKIGVGGRSLSDIHQKLVRAAAINHRQTGLAIVAHTGPENLAREEVAILREEGVAPEALVWTHAQNGTSAGHLELARRGVWVSLDGLGWVAPADHGGDSLAVLKYLEFLTELKKNDLLYRTLISHDAGWYTHGAEDQSAYKPYTPIFQILLPLLRQNGFTQAEIDQLLIQNPQEAYAIRVRSL